MVTAQVRFVPAETEATPLVRPVTSSGVELCSKHLRPPAVVTAQMLVSATETAATPLIDTLVVELPPPKGF